MQAGTRVRKGILTVSVDAVGDMSNREPDEAANQVAGKVAWEGGSAPAVGGSGDSPGATAADATGDEPEVDTDDVFDDEPEVVDMSVKPLEEIAPDRPEEVERRWYILKVQTNRENSICEALRRRVSQRGLDAYFGEVIVPTEDVAEFKNGKRRVVKRKLYPGYIVVNMSLTDDTWFVVRETPGIGDFTGSSGKPAPMLAEEIERILASIHPEKDGTESVKTAIPFKIGDRVRIKEGTFENFEGDVEGIDEANGRVTVMINIFGRSTPVELEHWQIEAI
jgi:transcription termination/antitermination protein NusG